MTTIPPTPPGVPSGSFPFQVQPYNNITPLTNRDGLTLLEMYRDLRHWLFRELVPYIDGTIADYVDAFNASVGQIALAITDLHTFVDASKTDIDAKVDAFNTLANTANTNFNAAVTAALTNIQNRVDAAVIAQHAAEAARDLASQYAATAGQQVDTNVAAFVGNVASSTYAALAATPAVTSKLKVPISITQKTSPTWGRYSVVETLAGVLMPGNSLITKRIANDFDVTNPGSTGDNFVPVRESVASMAKRSGANVAANASGWYIYPSAPGRMRGPQIRNGVAYRDFDATTLAGSPAGVEAIGLRKDGRLKCYSALRGDTAASMIADGVTDSWSYGPNLVVDGVGQDLTTKNWQYYLTEISARTIIGQRQNGDTVIIATVGKTGATGIGGNDMVTLAQSEGLFNAALMDGGGSTQLYADGFYNIPSSDLDGTPSDGTDGTFGRRRVVDIFALRGSLVTAPLDTGWQTLPLRAGYITNQPSAVPQVRTLNGITELRGQVKPTTGSFNSDGTSEFVADMPQQFGHETGAKPFLCPGDSANYRKVTVQSDRSIQVVGSTNSPAYIVLDGIRWGTQTI